MLNLDCLIYSSIMEVVTIIGMVINAFIAVVNIIDITKGRALKPVDKVLLSLGLCRFVLQALLIMDTVKYFIWFSDVPFQAETALWLGVQKALDHCNLWLTAWLCLLYCVKIVHCRLHSFLKQKIPRLILPVIVESVLMSMLSGGLLAWSFHEKFIKSTSKNSSIHLDFEINIPPLVIGQFLPFLIAAISTLLLLKTLLGHVCRIKNRGDFSSLKMDIHIASIRTVLLFFLISALKLISIIVKKVDEQGEQADVLEA
ncbi:taste receptor type 2 member 4-like [Pyxicephalus adspersus]|uniref:taste receptor type 2 member 4-like n=1 Tax=Pyxicephalus adspersus TaxID=30357 RepID=UPI003B59F93A